MVTIRRALPSEADCVTELGVRSKAVWGYSADVMRTFEAELQVPTSQIVAGRCFVLCDDGLTLGYYTLEPINTHEVELQHLFVDPNHLGQNHGSTLLQHALIVARTRAFRRMNIQSDPNSVGFYQKHGIPVVKEIPSSIPGRSLPCLELELEASNVTQRDHTAFSDAIEHGDVASAESLICQHPQLVNHPDWTPPPLHCAILWNQLSAVKLLLDYGANIEMRDPDRQTTPLRYAIMYCKPDVIPTLLTHGAKTDPIVQNGTTALELAKDGALGAFEEYEDLPRREMYEKVLSVLIEHGVAG